MGPLTLLGRATGLLASLLTSSLWLVFLFSAPATESGAATATFFVVLLMVGIATLGVLGAWRGRPYLMLAMFVFSFFPMGLYLLGTPGIYRWIGVFDFLYLVSGVLMIVGARRESTR
jgi:hypothetical protein